MSEAPEQANPAVVPGPISSLNLPNREFIDAKSDGHLLTLEGRVLSPPVSLWRMRCLSLARGSDVCTMKTDFATAATFIAMAQGRYIFHTSSPRLPGSHAHFTSKYKRRGCQVDDALFFQGARNQADSIYSVPQLL